MFKISGKFFLLFTLVTVLPVGIIVILNIYTSKQFHDHFIKELSTYQYDQTKRRYNSFLHRDLKRKEKLLHLLSDSNVKPENIANILNFEGMGYLKCNKEKTICQIQNLISKNYKPDSKITFNKPIESKPFGYYELLTDLSTKKKNLVGIFIYPIKTSNFDGILAINKVNFEHMAHLRPPVLMRVSTGEKVNKKAVIYFGTDKDFMKGPPPAFKKLPLPGFKKGGAPDFFKEIKKLKNLTLIGKIIPLKNRNNKTIANVEIGVPKRDVAFWESPHPPQNESFKHLYTLLFSIPVLGIILSLVAALYIKKNYINPVQNLSEISEKVSGGDFSERVTTTTKQQQIQNTLDNFNKMLDTIEDGKQLHESFVKNLTHDLRTPLYAESRALYLLVEDAEECDNDSQKDLLLTLIKNNEHLLTMVNLLLETYQFEDGKIEINKESLNVCNLAEECIGQLAALALEKNITLNNNISKEISEITADRDTLKRVFINLIANAIENIPKESTIDLFADTTNNILKINVKDNGPGIPDEHKNKIFDRYYAGERTERKIGSGLGLYICKKIIEAHNGTIEIDTVKGEYTNFIISLPGA